MSIDTRLTDIQSKVDNLIEISRNWSITSGCQTQDDNWERREQVKSAQAEIRSLEFWRSVVAECLGTLCYVFFVCGVSIPWTGHFPPFLSIAFASACAYGALTYSVFPKAHLNPAFTLGLASIKRISPVRCLLFLTAQAGGSIAGAAILFGLTVSGYQGSLGGTTLASHINPLQGFGLELILSFVLTLTFVSTPNNCIPTTAVLLAANLVALPCTGAGLNPARSLGPAFVMNKWPNHWIFWLGPLLGGLCASYLHRFILRRNKHKKIRESPSDGVSIDIPPIEQPPNPPVERLFTDRFEPIYGGTKSLYMKPSPVLPRSNLSRSQSVYQSKRFEYPQPPKFVETSSSERPAGSSAPNKSSGKGTNHQQDINYESLYERKSGHHSLLVSGPPSYDSAYYKTSYDISSSSSNKHSSHNSHNNHNHNSHNHNQLHSHHQKEKNSENQQNRENQTNRILAQYESTKPNHGNYMDMDQIQIQKGNCSNSNSNSNSNKSSSSNSSNYYNSENSNRHNNSKDNSNNHNQSDLESSRSSGNNHNNSSGPLPPRFRPQQPPPPPQSHPLLHCNDLNRKGSIMENTNNMAKRPYEYLDSNSNSNSNKKQLVDLNTSPEDNYTTRLLLAERDSTYGRILEPIFNSAKPLPPSGPPGGMCALSPHPHEQITFSYH